MSFRSGMGLRTVRHGHMKRGNAVVPSGAAEPNSELFDWLAAGVDFLHLRALNTTQTSVRGESPRVSAGQEPRAENAYYHYYNACWVRTGSRHLARAWMPRQEPTAHSGTPYGTGCRTKPAMYEEETVSLILDRPGDGALGPVTRQPCDHCPRTLVLHGRQVGGLLCHPPSARSLLPRRLCAPNPNAPCSLHRDSSSHGRRLERWLAAGEAPRSDPLPLPHSLHRRAGGRAGDMAR